MDINGLGWVLKYIFKISSNILSSFLEDNDPVTRNLQKVDYIENVETYT